jgi:hypothetical protein
MKITIIFKRILATMLTLEEIGGRLKFGLLGLEYDDYRWNILESLQIVRLTDVGLTKYL